MAGNGTLTNGIPLLPNGNPLFDFNQNPHGLRPRGPDAAALSTDFRVDPQRPILNCGVSPTTSATTARA